MGDFNLDGLNRLQESLEATNVLSEDYRKTILRMALNAVSEAWGNGVRDAKDQDAKVFTSVASSIEAFMGEQNRPSDSHLRQWANSLRQAVEE